jgi:hypothetical protein
MFLRPHLIVRVSVVVLLCTLSTCLWSAPVGPYSVVHGPVTAFRALRASILVFWSIVVAAFSPSLARRLLCIAWASSMTDVELLVVADMPLSLVLRC